MDKLKKIAGHLCIQNSSNNDYLIRMSYEYYYKRNMKHNLDWMNDFYKESPNWYQNNDLNTMESTIKWFHLNDKEKVNKLDNDLNSYFNITYDGEL